MQFQFHGRPSNAGDIIVREEDSFLQGTAEAFFGEGEKTAHQIKKKKKTKSLLCGYSL